ncbi:MAG: J domain-containing protein [Candidatus Limnocylindrales bacterium]
MDYKDYYAVLGVPRTASQTEIKKSFRKLARQHHPDAKPGDAAAERRFKEINEANAVLSDKDKRGLYDRLGADWEAYGRPGAPADAAGRGAAGRGSGGRGPTGDPYAGFSTGPAGGNVRYEFHSTAGSAEYSDFFNAFFSGAAEPADGATDRTAAGRGRRATGGPTFQDILAGMGLNANGGAATGSRAAPSGGTRPGGPRPAASAEAVAEITIDEAYHGTTRRIEVEGKRLEVTIPAGADTGTRIRLSGKAPGGGDIHVVVRQGPDPVYTRRGADLERDLALTLGEALLGADIPVGTPKGRILLTIPPGTQPGRTFRLTGRGLPRFKGAGHGDVYVKTRLVLPADLSDEARVAARSFIDLADQPDPRTREI